MDIRTRYLRLLRANSLSIGRFTLTSGKTSRYYFDAKRTTLDPEGAYLGAKLILEKMKQERIEAQAIGGLTLGADPIVAAVAAVSWAERRLYPPIQAFIARKEVKSHGTQRAIEGFRGDAGTPVVVIDDVCTTGGSTLAAVRRAEEAGLRVAAVMCLVDREQGGAEALRAYPFYALVTARELLDDPEIQKQLARLDENRPRNR